MNEEYSIKLFNIYQANKFIKGGCKPIGCALGDKQKAYIEFLVDENFINCMKKWRSRLPLEEIF